MKLSLFIIIYFLFLSCASRKKTAQNNTKPLNESTIVLKKENDTIKASQNIAETKIVHEKEIDFDVNKKVTLNDTVSYHKNWNELLNKNVSETGNVNYKSIKKDWQKLRIYFSELNANIPNSESSKEEKLAFWINAYNAFTLDLILRHYPIKSIKDIKDPWQQRLWKLGDKWYNLEEIEHQILRKMDEPRIHFAIVCASYSCPKLQNKAFMPSTLENQLTIATRTFLHDPERNSISNSQLELSKIFQWFSKDFKQNGSLIDFLNKYSDLQISEDAKISFKKYNWDLNE